MPLHTLYRAISSAITCALVLVLVKCLGPWTVNWFQAFGLWAISASVAFGVASAVWWTLERIGDWSIRWKISRIEFEEEEM